MASENVIAMMVKKGAPFTVEQLQGMEDGECWRWIYDHFPPKTKRPDPLTPEICFTGFRPDDKARLEGLAERAGYRTVRSVTLRLKVLVTGEAPGPAKLEKARQHRVTVLSEAEFLAKISANPEQQP